MRENGLEARLQATLRAHDRPRTTQHPSRPTCSAATSTPKAANTAWAGDVTYIATAEGWAYLAVLLDLFSRRVVGLGAPARSTTASLALDALSHAVRLRRPAPGLVHHTERGSPYASDEYRKRSSPPAASSPA